MAPERKSGGIDPLADEHFTKPTAPDGIGPTLGEDVSPEHEREEDAEAAAFRRRRGGVPLDRS